MRILSHYLKLRACLMSPLPRLVGAMGCIITCLGRAPCCLGCSGCFLNRSPTWLCRVPFRPCSPLSFEAPPQPPRWWLEVASPARLSHTYDGFADMYFTLPSSLGATSPSPKALKLPCVAGLHTLPLPLLSPHLTLALPLVTPHPALGLMCHLTISQGPQVALRGRVTHSPSTSW